MKILLVDDHPLICEGVRTLLESSSQFEIIGEAGDSQLALELIQIYKPDLVILDISMPRVSGIETAKMILKLRRETKILFFPCMRKKSI